MHLSQSAMPRVLLLLLLGVAVAGASHHFRALPADERPSTRIRPTSMSAPLSPSVPLPHRRLAAQYHISAGKACCACNFFIHADPKTRNDKEYFQVGQKCRWGMCGDDKKTAQQRKYCWDATAESPKTAWGKGCASFDCVAPKYRYGDREQKKNAARHDGDEEDEALIWKKDGD